MLDSSLRKPVRFRAFKLRLKCAGSKAAGEAVTVEGNVGGAERLEANPGLFMCLKKSGRVNKFNPTCLKDRESLKSFTRGF